MKNIVIVSDFLEHHTLPLCESFELNNDVKITYIATTPTPASRIALGYEDMNEKYPFVLKAYESKKTKKESYEVIKKADLVILGGVWGKYSSLCNKYNIPTMRISERFLKGKLNKIKQTLKVLKYRFLARHEKNVLLLCCGKYSFEDFNKTKRYKNSPLRVERYRQLELAPDRPSL